MRVIIEKKAIECIDAFYCAAMQNHPLLSEETVMKKKQRLISSLNSLGEMPSLYAKSRLKEDWIRNGWREYLCEDFHFAYEICRDEVEGDFVWVHDAVHSLLYY